MDANYYQLLALRTEKTPAFVKDSAERKVLLANKISGKTPMARLLHGLLGMTSEVGEIADMTKGHIVYGKPFDRPNVLEECGDVLWFLSLALDACGYSLAEAMEANIEKLTARYPKGFTKKHARNRDKQAERKLLVKRKAKKTPHR